MSESRSGYMVRLRIEVEGCAGCVRGLRREGTGRGVWRMREERIERWLIRGDESGSWNGRYFLRWESLAW